MLKVIILLLITYLSVVQLSSIPARQSSNCAYLIDKIYCYGGNVTASTENDALYSLELSKKVDSFEQLNQQWSLVNPANPDNIQFERRSLSQAVGLPNGKELLIQGGYNLNDSALMSQTLLFNAETNSWKALPNYNDPNNGGDRQVYFGTVQSIPNLNSLGFYGGYQQHVELGGAYFLPSGGNMTNFTTTDSNGYSMSYIGFFYITYLNLDTFTWSIPTQYQTPAAKHSGLSGTYHPVSKKIYYLGGDHFDQNVYRSDMLHSMTYDTVSGLWTKDNITAAVYPRQRKMHTATLLPDNQTILIYGGTYDDITPVKDFCFLMHIPTMTWYFQDIKPPLGKSGARFQHSAVLVDNKSLFILFGVDNSTAQTNELLILAVKDTQSIQFVSSYPLSAAEGSKNNSSTPGASTSTTKDNNNSDTTTDKGLSKEAIAGIAVGCAAAGIIAIILGLLYYRKKSKSKTEKDSQLLEVDWDKIDSQFYREIGTTTTPNDMSTIQQLDSSTQNTVVKPNGLEKTVVLPEGKDIRVPEAREVIVPDINEK